MSDCDNTAHDMVSTNFGPPNEITVLFDDRMQTLYCSASTIAKHIHPWIPIGTVTASIQ
jgi:hypothetical protein